MVIPLQERKGHGFPVFLAASAGQEKTPDQYDQGLLLIPGPDSLSAESGTAVGLPKTQRERFVVGSAAGMVFVSENVERTAILGRGGGRCQPPGPTSAACGARHVVGLQQCVSIDGMFSACLYSAFRLPFPVPS